MNAEQEAQYLTQYEPLFKSLAWKYRQRAFSYDHGRTEYDDLLQTLRLAFVEHLRSDRFDPNKIGYTKGMLHAMFECARHNALLSIPYYCFCRVAGECRETPSDVLDRMTDGGNEARRTDLRLDVTQWLEGLPGEDAEIAYALMSGDTFTSLRKAGRFEDRNHERKVRRRMKRSMGSV